MGLSDTLDILCNLEDLSRKTIRTCLELCSKHTTIKRGKFKFCMHPKEINEGEYQPFTLTTHGAGVTTKCGFVGKNDHTINLVMCEALVFERGCCCLFVEHFLHCLVERVDLILVAVIGQYRCFSSYIAAMTGQR